MLADVGGNDMWQHSYVFNDSADNVESLAKGRKSGNFIVFRPSDQILKMNVPVWTFSLICRKRSSL